MKRNKQAKNYQNSNYPTPRQPNRGSLGLGLLPVEPSSCFNRSQKKVLLKGSLTRLRIVIERYAYGSSVVAIVLAYNLLAVQFP